MPEGVNLDKFRFENIQFVLFPEFFNLPEPDKRAEFLAKFKTAFPDSQEMILPIPSDAPDEIPVMVLGKKDEYEINFSKKRIDFIFAYKPEDKNIDEIFRSFFLPKTVNLLNIFDSNFKDMVKFKNIGCIIRSALKIDNPNVKMKKFLKDETSLFSFNADSQNLIRSLGIEDLSVGEKTFKINKIITFHTNFTDKETKERIIFFEFDMNTFPETKEGINEKVIIENFLDQEIKKNNDFLNKIYEIIQ